LLYERNDKAATPLLTKMVAESSSALGRLQALCALDGVGAMTQAVLAVALKDKDEHVREHAVRLAENLAGAGGASEKVVAMLAPLATDPSPRVRFQVALAAGPNLASGIGQALSRDSDPWIAAALASAPPSQCTQLLHALLASDGNGASPEVLAKLARVAGATARGEELRLTIAKLSETPDVKLIRAFAEGLKRGGATLAKVDTEKKLAAVFTNAVKTATDAKAASGVRTESLSLLALATLGEAQPALEACLAKDQPEAAQTAAVSALGQFNAREVTQTLLQRWPDLKPKAQTAALVELLSRADRTKPLLEAVQSNRIPASALSASQVQSLLKHEDKAIAGLAKTALASVIPPSRESVLAKFQPALTAKGDMAKGQMVFLQRCIACHKAAGQGIEVGPDFVTVKTKGKEALLTAILDPHKEVAPQFIAYTVNTKDGQTLAGIVTKDDASSMTLKMMGGAEINLPRSNIKGSSSSGQSLMPEGIETGMSVQDMADLLEFMEKAQ
jgi:putative heme-binding domain-containing protein